MAAPEPWLTEAATLQVLRILRSYTRWTNRVLLPEAASPAETAQAAFEAPFVLLAHGTEADPILHYGNRKALELWEMDWSEFVRMPSRQTAEVQQREDRARVLAEVAARGFSDGYEGVRISRGGKRFRIEKACVWNVLDEAGQPAGQAASFRHWVNL